MDFKHLISYKPFNYKNTLSGIALMHACLCHACGSLYVALFLVKSYKHVFKLFIPYNESGSWWKTFAVFVD